MELLKSLINGVGSAAMVLSMTKSIYDEQAIKMILQELGYKFAVTEIGGNVSHHNFQEKVTRGVVGAVLNNNVVKKESYEIHAVMHATMEAKSGVMGSLSNSANVTFKIAIARKDEWVAVALFGESAIYHVTNHERCGLGVMHI